MTKALLITVSLLLVLVSQPSSSSASSSFMSPIPNYQPPQVMGESVNNNPDSGSFANLGFPDYSKPDSISILEFSKFTPLLILTTK